MNRSITQKILLVFVLVTLIDGGILSESAMSTAILSAAQPTEQQNAGSASDSNTDGVMADYWQLSRPSDCPYHRNASVKKSTRLRVMPD